MNLINESGKPQLKKIDLIFIFSSISFNLFVSLLYLSTKFENLDFMRLFGALAMAMIIPFIVAFVGYIRSKAEKKIIISMAIILLYFSIEFVLDYILFIPFRDIPILHVPYIIVFYAASFSMIGVSFDKSKKLGFIVLISYFVLLGCLIFMYLS